MLRSILDEFENNKRAISVKYLSRKLGVEEDTLQGMLAFLVQKGKLKEVSVMPEGHEGEMICPACSVKGECSFMNLPKTYALCSGSKTSTEQ